jgi:predicted lipoprotein with Yx(FWY)xxD motif
VRTRLLLLASLLVLAAAAGAGAHAGARGSATVSAGSSAYGRILFDARGFVLYAFTRDGRGGSTCSGACAKAWPPYLVAGTPRAAGGARASLVGTTRRPDGRLQATYGGRPLYYYVGDTKPGRILCQNVREYGGVWLVVHPSGALVR